MIFRLIGCGRFECREFGLLRTSKISESLCEKGVGMYVRLEKQQLCPFYGLSFC
jgi:hypothetical protein